MPFDLTLFFTRGNSLQTWNCVGMLAREVAIYRRLVERGHSVNFVSYGRRDKADYAEQLPGIRILDSHLIPRRRIYIPLIPLIHGNTLRKTDVIKTNQMAGADIALRSARFWNKPIIARMGYMWSHHAANQFGYESEQAQLARKIEADVLPSVDRIVVTAPQMMDDIVNRFPQTADKIHIIPNNVDTSMFCPTRQDQQYDILFIGRLEKQKNINSLLQAITTLDLKALIVGNGSLATEVESYLQNSRIEWRNRVPNTDIPGLMNSARLFVLPSHYEGHPKTLIEAMACGLPVLGANSPGIRDVIQHGQNGWLCETDSHSIAEAIDHILSDRELQVSLGRQARKFAVDNYALDRIVDKEIQLIESLL
jgi:glycosyltransferase involved in cell wall biosynthesis